MVRCVDQPGRESCFGHSSIRLLSFGSVDIRGVKTVVCVWMKMTSGGVELWMVLLALGSVAVHGFPTKITAGDAQVNRLETT